MSDSPQKPRSDMPPVPRDFNEASHSELVPLKSSTINLFKSPIFYLVVVTGIIAIATFGYLGQVLGKGSLAAFQNFVWVVIGYLLLVVLLVMYLYSKTDKPFWGYLLNAGFVSMLLLVPLLGMPFFFVFRSILPGGASMTGAQDFVSNYIGMFFGAGLMEELMKVTLVLFGAYIAVNAVDWKKRLPEKLYDLLCIRGPLDGLIMGLFGGAGFILIETGGQYIPQTFQGVAQQTGNDGMGLAAALMLLIPRVVGGMVGHMAWAGINGYFIGLAVIRPNGALKMLALSWVGTSALHAMWNTQGHVPMFAYLSAGLGGAFVVACLLKARQLEMSMGRSVETYGSIVVQPKKAPPTAPQGSPPPAAAAAAPSVAAASSAGSSAANSAAPSAAPAPQTQAGATPQLRLIFDSATVPVVMGQALDLSGIPSLGAAAQGIQAEVTQHPTRPEVMGLKNLGANNWVATLRDGSEQRIVPERNIRLANGVKIDFGGGLIAEVML